MGNPFDKANWSAENTSIFCEICLEEKRAGNHSNGFITNRGYVNISEKYYNSTHLKHSRKQLRNRWDQLKRLYQFWPYLHTILHTWEEIFEQVAVDGSSACIPGEIIGDGIDEVEDQEEDGKEYSPMSVSARKRASSTTTTATSPTKKNKESYGEGAERNTRELQGRKFR